MIRSPSRFCISHHCGGVLPQSKFLAIMDETEIMLADAAEALLADRHYKERLRLSYERRNAYDASLWLDMAAQGWLGITLPEALGGVELQTRHAAVIARKLGRHVVPEPFVASGVMLASLAARLHEQNVEAWQTVAQRLQGGESILALAWQEDLAALNVQPEQVTAEPVADGVIINGSKLGVVAADVASHLLITASNHGVPQLVLIAANAPGVTLRRFAGADGSSICNVELKNVQATSAQCLASGEALLAALRYAVNEALILTSAKLLGAAEQALEMTLEYMRTRVQFGKAIGSFQSLQHLAVDVRVQQSLAQAALIAALQAFEAEPEGAATAAAIARAKARTSQAALQAGRFGVQAHGAIGFAAEADIGLYLKSALRLSAYLGNASQHHHALIELGAGLKNVGELSV